MPKTPPPPVPETPPVRQHPSVVLPIVLAMVRTTSNPQDRQRFITLLDAANDSSGRLALPLIRSNGRADQGTRTAVIFTAVVEVLRKIRSGATFADVKKALDFAHNATFVQTARVIGSQAEGYTLQFPPYLEL